MKTEKISVRTEKGQMLEVQVLHKRASGIEVVLGEGVHSVRCELVPTRTSKAYVGFVMGREIVYEKSTAQVQEELDRADPSQRKSRPSPKR